MMRVGVTALALLTLSFTGGGSVSALARGYSASSCAGFQVVTAPKVAGGRADSISGTSSNDIWTVGLGTFQPTILHWDGARWSVSPQDSTLGSSTAVAAISPDDAWLVGSNPPEGPHPMAKHWDGTLWRTVAMPQVESSDTLTSIAALSSTDVWAIGHLSGGPPIYPLVMHWNGNSWKQVRTQDGVQSSGNVLLGISAVGDHDIWAVGYQALHGNNEPLVEHFDGRAWGVVPSPVLPGNDNRLNAVSARTPSDVWAVGYQGDRSTEFRTLAEHWDGTSWSVVPTPDVGGTIEVFGGVDALSANDAWAVGSRQPESADLTLAEHWDGTSWTLVTSPPTSDGGLGAVLAISPTEVWATGAVFDPSISNFRPLTMRSKGCGG